VEEWKDGISRQEGRKEETDKVKLDAAIMYDMVLCKQIEMG
jgi:hypothetical protein